MLRLLGGLAGGTGIVVARAMVRDLYAGPALARVFALLMLVMGVAPIGAPLLGGLLLQFTSWRGLFAALAVLGIVLLVGAATLGETLPADRRRAGGLRTTAAALRSVLRDRTFLVPALVGAVGVCGMFVYIAMASYVLQEPTACLRSSSRTCSGRTRWPSCWPDGRRRVSSGASAPPAC